jgi:hypothetical protein
MWLSKIRYANIDAKNRVQFELLGEHVVAMAIANHATTSAPILHGAYLNQDQAVLWLRERRDIKQRREDRLEIVEWAILIFVAFSLITDVVIMIHNLWFE